MKIAIFGDSLTARACAAAYTDRNIEVFLNPTDVVGALAKANSCVIASEPSWGQSAHLLLPSKIAWLRGILDGCLAHQVVRIVYVSSVATLGAGDRPRNANDLFVPGSSNDPYFVVPATMEAEIYRYLLADLSIVPVLTSLAVDQEHDDDYGLLRLVKKMPVVPAQGGVDLVDVRDVVRGVIQAERTGRAGRRYVLNGRFFSPSELANALGHSGVRTLRTGGLTGKVLARVRDHLPVGSIDRLAPIRHAIRIEDERARGELGFRARDVIHVLRASPASC